MSNYHITKTMNTFSITGVYKAGWALCKKYLTFFITSSVIYFVFFIIINYIADKGTIWSAFLSIVSTALSIMFSIGMIKNAFAIYAGQAPSSAHFKTDFRTILRIFWASIIVMFFSAIGLILLIIPGIIVMLRLSLTSYVVIDKGMTGWQSVKESWILTRGHSWNILGFLLLALVISTIAMIPVGLGLIIAVPWIILSSTGVYIDIRNRVKQSVSSVVTPLPMVEEKVV